MRVSGVVKILGETSGKDDDTVNCVSEIQETVSELQDALFSLPSAEIVGKERKEVEYLHYFTQTLCR